MIGRENTDPHTVCHCLSLFATVVSEAKRIHDAMVEKLGKDAVPVKLLHDRLLLCEHASALNPKDIPIMNFKVLQAHVGQTSSLWPHYSSVLKVRLCLRHAVEVLQQACTAVKAMFDYEAAMKAGAQAAGVAIKLEKVTIDDVRGYVKKFLGFLKWNTGGHDEDSVDFQADCPRLDSVISSFMRSVPGSSGVSMDMSFGVLDVDIDLDESGQVCEVGAGSKDSKEAESLESQKKLDFETAVQDLLVVCRTL